MYDLFAFKSIFSVKKQTNQLPALYSHPDFFNKKTNIQMKATQIRFFSPQDNSKPKEKSKALAKPVPVTGYISSAGKLVFPDKAVAKLGLDPENIQFKIGIEDGKRKVKALYLVPATDGQSENFGLEKAAKSYTLSIPVILQKSKIDYANTKYVFEIKPFDYEEGITGYELQLSDQEPKPAYVGKPRGRRPKAA